MLHAIRSRTPLDIRQKIGPKVAYINYIYSLYIGLGKWKPKVLSDEDTLDKIIKENLSVIRFGDGEISLIDGLDLGFQKNDKNLVKSIEQILKARDAGLLLCVPNIWGRLDDLEDYAYWFNMHHLYRCGYVWNSVLSKDQIYGSSAITRPYLAYKDKSKSGAIFKKLFSIWEGKDVVLIEGSKSRLGVGNDMFDKVKSIKRILCPPEDAYSKYEEIKKEAMKISKDKMILLSLGPTAKVLAYDMFLAGYRVIDIGHVDMEYEMFLQKADKQVKVKYKYFNEIHERNPEDCKDAKYLSAIIATIE